MASLSAFAILLFFFANVGTLLPCVEAVTVCYGKYGCFSDDAPFDRPVPALPEDPREIGTKFRLYTRRTRGGETTGVNNITNSLSAGAFNAKHKVKIIIHGYTQSEQSAWVLKMVKELLKKEGLNVFVVDWSLGASFLTMYDLAAGNTRLVGVQVAELIDILNASFAVNLDDVHVIGHSLGAQIAGFAGEKLFKKNKTLGRITGLDPAGPGFDVNDAAARLDPSDAKFVDVIHTDGREGTLDSGLGLSRPCGHVDFYPNGGHVQPGCGSSHTFEEVYQLLVHPNKASLPGVIACNHMKSAAYFTASINSACAMTSYPCSSWEDFMKGRCLSCEGACTQMGYNADQNQGGRALGKMFLETMETWPHCAPQNYFKITLHSEGRRGLLSLLTTNAMGIKLIGTKGTVTTKTIRRVKAGKESFLVESTRDLGALKTVQVSFHGSGFYLKKVAIQSSDGHKRYTACFDKWLKSYFLFESYTRKAMEGHLAC